MSKKPSEKIYIYIFFICLLIIILNNYIYNTTKTKTKKKSTLTRDINREKQNQLSNYYRAKRNYTKVQQSNEIIRS